MNERKLVCPYCNTSLDATIELVGRNARCPGCRREIDSMSNQPSGQAEQDLTPPAPPKTSAAAIWSLILGILGMCPFCVPCWLSAIICGHISRSNISKSNGSLTGSGMALAGLILGYIGLLITVAGIAASILFAGLVRQEIKKANFEMGQEQRSQQQTQ